MAALVLTLIPLKRNIWTDSIYLGACESLWQLRECCWKFSSTGFRIAAGLPARPALWPPMPAIFHPRNGKKWYPIPWSAKSTSLERHSKRFISESNAAVKHLHTYQKWIGWRFKSFLNKKQQQISERSIIVSILVNEVFALATISICRHSFFSWSTTRLLRK